MQNFHITLHSFQEVQEFITLATVQPFAVLVGNEVQQVNGKSFMEMFCLNFGRPLKASMDCTEEEYQQFLRDADALLVK